jgi:hypothetical protein
MINLLRIIFQYIAIGSFSILFLLDLIEHNWNFAGLNLSLVFLYFFLYKSPFKK